VIRITHRSCGSGSSNGRRNVRIRCDLAVGDALQRAPAVVLKSSARNSHARHGEGTSRTVEVLNEFAHRGPHYLRSRRSGNESHHVVGHHDAMHAVIIADDTPPPYR